MTVILAHYIPATTSELEHWTCLHTILLIAHFPAQSRFLLPSPPATSLNRYVFLVFIMLANLVHATLIKTLVLHRNSEEQLQYKSVSTNRALEMHG